MKSSDLDKRLTNKLGFGKVLESITRHRQYYIGKKLEKFGLKKGEYRILIEVYIYEGCCQDFIANNLGIDKFDASKAIKSLIEKGYVYKKRDEFDKRKYMLYLTDKAKEIKSDFVEVLTSSAQVLTDGLTEEEKEFTLKMLIKIAENAYKQSQLIKNEK